LLSHDINIQIYENINGCLRLREERRLRVLKFRILQKIVFVGLKERK